MIALFGWIQRTPLSVWMREEMWGYFAALILHAWGMAFLVGGGLALSLRMMGVASAVPLDRFARFVPVMWVGAGLAVVSGLLLLVGYPAKALTNWVFAAKLGCLLAAALLVRRGLRRGDRPAATRWIGAAAFGLWIGVVAGGKLLLYTNRMLLVE